MSGLGNVDKSRCSSLLVMCRTLGVIRWSGATHESGYGVFVPSLVVVLGNVEDPLGFGFPFLLFFLYLDLLVSVYATVYPLPPFFASFIASTILRNTPYPGSFFVVRSCIRFHTLFYLFD